MQSQEFVKKRRDRVLATILSYKENNVDQYLPNQKARDDLRRVILNNVNDFNDLMLDILKAEPQGEVQINEYYVEALKRLGRIEDMLEDMSE